MFIERERVEKEDSVIYKQKAEDTHEKRELEREKRSMEREKKRE